MLVGDYNIFLEEFINRGYLWEYGLGVMGRGISIFLSYISVLFQSFYYIQMLFFI